MKETSRFYSSLGLLVLLNAVIKPLWIFGIDRQVQNIVGSAEYGTYFSILNLSMVLVFLLDWGLTVFYNRQLSANDTNTLDQAGSFIVVKLLFSLLYAALIFCIAYITGIKRKEIVIYVVAIQVLSSFFVFFRAVITSQQWFRTDAWLSVLDKLLMILLCGAMLYFPALMGGIDIERFLLLQTACMAFAVATALIILLLKKFPFGIKKILPDRQVFRAAIPFAVIVLLMSFHSRIDGFLLERISGATEAGKYAAAYRLLDAANVLGFLFASFLLPYITRRWKERKDISDVILNIRHLLVMAGVTISVIILFMAQWIQRILYHQEDLSSIEVLQWCLAAITGYYLIHVYGTVLTATGNIAAFSYITLVSVLINLTLNLILIPSIGAKGSCVAALISQGFGGLATMWYANRKLNIRLDIRSLLIYFFTGALLCGFLYVCNELQAGKWLMITGAGLITLVMLWITRLDDLNIRKLVARH